MAVACLSFVSFLDWEPFGNHLFICLAMQMLNELRSVEKLYINVLNHNKIFVSGRGGVGGKKRDRLRWMAENKTIL